MNEERDMYMFKAQGAGKGWTGLGFEVFDWIMDFAYMQPSDASCVKLRVTKARGIMNG